MEVPPPTAQPSPGPDYSLRRYLLEAVEVVTNADSRLVRTFRALVARPGALTAAYFTDERDTYLRPQQVLLFCSIFYFFTQPLLRLRALSPPLSTHMYGTPYARWVSAWVHDEVARRGGGMEPYRAAFDAAAMGHARTLAFVLVPLFALALVAAFWRPRRFFVEHLVFATHFVAFLLLVLPAVAVLTAPVASAGRALGLSPGGAYALADAGPVLATWGVYLYLALRRVYGHGRVLAAVKAAALSAGMASVGLTAYRLILFLATFHGL